MSSKAATDYASFYNNLQMLSHEQQELASMQALEKAWVAYRESA